MLLRFADWLVYQVFGFSADTRLGATVNFFVYDSIKILVLLFVLIFLIGFLRSFIAEEKIKQWIGKKGVAGNFYAALFGAVTPFCSCSSIPIFISFLKAGIPLGVSFSFLITSPLINEYLVVLMLAYFGWKITVFYVLSGILIGVIAGTVLGRMKLEHYLVEDLLQIKDEQILDQKNSFYRRLKYGWDEAMGITRKIWIWVLIGVGIGAIIHNYIPQETIQHVVGKAGVFSVPVATIIGVPMYGSCAAIVPIAVVLFQKGIPLGTALAFMMAVAALSLPEAVMLRRAMRLQLILMFFVITALAIMFTGYLFNFLQNILM